jgi:hypothetical protein
MAGSNYGKSRRIVSVHQAFERTPFNVFPIECMISYGHGGGFFFFESILPKNLGFKVKKNHKTQVISYDNLRPSQPQTILNPKNTLRRGEERYHQSYRRPFTR